MSTYVDPILALSAALFRELANDATLRGLVTAVEFDLPQNATFPIVWLELTLADDLVGFGSKSAPRLRLRAHVFQAAGGSARDAELAMQRIVDLLWNEAPPLAVDGYTILGGRPLPGPTEDRLPPAELADGTVISEFVTIGYYQLEMMTAPA